MSDIKCNEIFWQEIRQMYLAFLKSIKLISHKTKKSRDSSQKWEHFEDGSVWLLWLKKVFINESVYEVLSVNWLSTAECIPEECCSFVQRENSRYCNSWGNTAVSTHSGLYLARFHSLVTLERHICLEGVGQ